MKTLKHSVHFFDR